MEPLTQKPCTIEENEINLDHHVFLNYQGPVKCFRCGKTMENFSSEGNLLSTDPPVLSKISYSKNRHRARLSHSGNSQTRPFG